MTLKAIFLIGIVFVSGVAGSYALQTARMPTDPAAPMASFLLFRAHCPSPEPTREKTVPCASNKRSSRVHGGFLHVPSLWRLLDTKRSR